MLDDLLKTVIDEKREALACICRLRHAQRIELFGSGVTSSISPEKSDLDFLVTFRELPLEQYADAYFGLLEDLQSLFERPVNLVVPPAIQNPYFCQAVETSRMLLYAD